MRLALLALAACAAPRPAVVAIVSANAEWQALAPQLSGAVEHTPYGDAIAHPLAGKDVVFLHGGYGKVAAAGSTQYAIDRWHPQMVVNLGTCGGFGGARKVGDVVLASETIIYDLVERMGDPDEPIRDYRTKLDTSRWPAALRDKVVVAPLVSGDRDLAPEDVAALAAKYHASVGDWESGAIAWVATKHHVPVWILRAVTDIVDATGDPTYGDVGAWQRETKRAMAGLVELLAAALRRLE